MKRIMLVGGEMDQCEIEVRDGCTVAYAVDNPEPNVLVWVAYEPTPEDPTVWAMRPLTPEEEAERVAEMAQSVPIQL